MLNLIASKTSIDENTFSSILDVHIRIPIEPIMAHYATHSIEEYKAMLGEELFNLLSKIKVGAPKS